MAEITVEPKETIVEKARAFLERLREAHVDVESAYLYGSHATGAAGPDSDIDVAIVSSDLSGDRVEDWMRLNRISTQIDVRMEVIGFRPEQFRDENPLVWEVKTRGVQLI
ncbi:MAG: nucleotidyltransferase domain-containing protein [Chloroflexota bacterium]